MPNPTTEIPADRPDPQPPLSAGQIEIGLAALGTLRWVAADITLPLEEARHRLDLSPLAAVALGRGLTAAALLQRFALKVPSRLLVEIQGDGPLGKIVAEADDRGHLRGLVGEPQLATPEDGELSIREAVGRGFLRVTRQGDAGQRYSSQVELVSGELGDDLTHYLEQSEQIRSAVLLGVLPRSTGIVAAGGLIVEALPGTEEEIITRLEENLRALEGVSRTLERGGVDGLVGQVLEGFDLELLERLPLEYRCRCGRERLLVQLQSIARQDPDALIGDDGLCVATCSFCAARYEYTREELVEPRAEIF